MDADRLAFHICAGMRVNDGVRDAQAVVPDPQKKRFGNETA
jgi:hypothetical protein